MPHKLLRIRQNKKLCGKYVEKMWIKINFDYFKKNMRKEIDKNKKLSKFTKVNKKIK